MECMPKMIDEEYGMYAQNEDEDVWPKMRDEEWSGRYAHNEG